MRSTRVHCRCSEDVNTGVQHTHVRGPCSPAPVHTIREHGPSTRPVNTGNVYRSPVSTVHLGKEHARKCFLRTCAVDTCDRHSSSVFIRAVDMAQGPRTSVILDTREHWPSRHIQECCGQSPLCRRAVIDNDVVIMVALCNRADHYIFML